MPSPPSSLGPYPVERELGRGGMGVVYLARDPRLDRPVAIKVLPDALALNPESLARFEREAKLLASLNHPNIATVYGVEEAKGQQLLVLEYVPGDTLAVRIARGPLPIAEAIDVGRQIALAVEAAHDGGVIHRDLKPGNVKVTPDGVVKVLDFGLAKSATVSDAELAHSPTITYAPTNTGVILGTAGYMSPEQARGKAVDRRTDIWSFGCVLFECLAGREIFEGETVSDTIAKILEREPDWSALPAATPPRVRDLLRRCLEKDLKKRQRDIGDVRLELDDVIAGRGTSIVTTAAAPVASPAAFAPWRLMRATLLVFAGAVAGVGVWKTLLPAAPARAGAIHLSAAVPADINLTAAGIMGDGRTLVAIGGPSKPDGSTRGFQVYTRQLDEDVLKPVPGTQGWRSFTASPDGLWVAGLSPIAEGASQMKLVKVPIDGSSPPTAIADAEGNWSSFGWLESGDLLITLGASQKYFRLPRGGMPTAPVMIDLDAKLGWYFGAVLPRDRGVFISAVTYGARSFQEDAWVLDLKTNKPHRLLENAGSVWYARTGHIVFTRRGTLLAAPFDLDTLAVTGEAVALSKDLLVTASNADGWMTLSPDGTLVFAPGGTTGLDRRLVVIDRTGAVTPFGSERREYHSEAVSHDGLRVATVITNPTGTDDIWVTDRDGSFMRRAVATPGADCFDPVWSPDGQRIAYARFGFGQDNGVYVQRVDGSDAPQSILKIQSGDVYELPESWTSNGSGILIRRIAGQTHELRLVPVGPDGPTGSARVLRASPHYSGGGEVSPDGRLVTFVSDESGAAEIYVATYAAGGAVGPAVMISRGSTSNANWSEDGRRIFYANNNTVESVTVQTIPALAVSTPGAAFDLSNLRIDSWTLLPGGRLLGVQHDEGLEHIPAFTVVLNWFDELRARMNAHAK